METSAVEAPPVKPKPRVERKRKAKAKAGPSRRKRVSRSVATQRPYVILRYGRAPSRAAADELRRQNSGDTYR